MFFSAACSFRSNAQSCPVITVNPAALPDGLVGSGYNQSLGAAGGSGPYTFSVIGGVLPAGLSLSEAGVLAGTLGEIGTSSFTVMATDANGCSGTNGFTVVIVCPTIVVNPTALPDGLVGSAYRLTLSATGGFGPYAFSVTVGALPAGFSLSGEGVLTGRARVLGTSSFTVQTTDTNGCSGSRSYTLAVTGVVPIPDPHMKAAICSALGRPRGEVPVTDLLALTNLCANDANIADLTGLEQAQNLMTLDLGGNVISNLAPLQHLRQLTCLILYNNRVNDLSPLSDLTNLTTLHLGGNAVSDVAPLQHLNLLTNLFLYRNAVTNLSALAGLTNLSYLELRWNALTNCNALAGLNRLKSLYLGGNSIGSLTFLQSLSGLTLLDLDNSNVGDVLFLSGLTNLSVLDLGYNPLTNTAPLGAFTSLVGLYLSGDSISNLAFVQNLTQLASMILYGNVFTNLSPLATLSNLSVLNIGGNPANADFNVLSGLTNLTSLWLHGNSVSNLAFLVPLTQLEVLNLANNGLSELSPLAGLAGLRILSLVGNQITNCIPLSGLSNLAHLDLGNNRVTDSTVLAGLTNLTDLRLGANAVSDLSFLDGLSQLITLNLDQNPVPSLSPLVTLPSLRALGLGFMPLTSLEQVGIMTNLAWLRLSGNSVGDLTFVTNLTGLRFLDLATNVVSDLSPLIAMTNLSGLVCVDLRWNRLDVSSNSAAMTAIANLASWRVDVLFQPQDQPPTIFPGDNSPQSLSAEERWGVAWNVTSVAVFSITDDVTAVNRLRVRVDSSNSALLPTNNIVVGTTNGQLALMVTPVAGQMGMTAITLTVTDGAELSTSFTIWVSVLPPDPVTIPDPSLANALRLTLGKPTGDLTKVDLFALTTVFAGSQSISNLTGLEWAGNLRTLLLWDNSISDLSPLQDLSSLSVLDLVRNQIIDLSPLAGLTNIQFLNLQQNRLTNILALTNLPQSASLDISLNLLDLSQSSSVMTAIQGLTNRGLSVVYLPLRTPPSIAVNANWVIPANASSWLDFFVSDNATFVAPDNPSSADFSVTAASSNTNLIPDANLAAVYAGVLDAADWFLSVTPAGNQVGTTTITLTVMNNAGLSTNVSILVMVAEPLPLAGGVFPDSNLTSWLTGGDTPWYGQTSVTLSGVAAAQSGSSTNNGDSWLQASVTGPAILSFWWKVSSETNYDFLTFYVGTNLAAQISGEVDWQRQIYNLPPGSFTLLWDYSKDPGFSSGGDAGWLAQVSLAPATWLQVAAGPTNGECALNLWLLPGKAYEVQYSTNFMNWSFLGSVTNPATGTATNQFMDTNATPPARFYRLRAR